MHPSSSMRATLHIAYVLLPLLAAMAAPASSQTYDSLSHTRAAAEIVDMLRIEEQTLFALRAALSGASAENPEGARVAEAMVTFLYDVVPWDTARAEYIRIYREQFTESELRELVRFFSTPVGRTMVARTPQIVAATSAVMQRLMAPHLPELQRRINAALGGG
jgi:uncharacterized protein